MARGGYRAGAGRPKAQHTIQAEKARAELIATYLENIKPINEALVKKARDGDIQAIRELHDRVFGKAPQAVTGPDGGELVIHISSESAKRFKLN